MMSFTLEPKDLSANVTRVTLNLDGQSLVYFNNATRPQPMTWPGKDGTGVITLAFQPIDGSPEIRLNETGSWAWLRMLRSGRFTGTSLTDVYSLRLGDEGFLRRFRAEGRERRKPVQSGDVQEVHMSAADMILPAFTARCRPPAISSRARAPDFVQPLDRWLASISRPLIGTERWDQRTALRFLSGPAAFGSAIGIILASRDRVGRRFPLSIVATPGVASLALVRAEAWFQHLRRWHLPPRPASSAPTNWKARSSICRCLCPTPTTRSSTVF